LTELLARIAGSALATWTRESPSLWAYPAILTLHTVGLGIVAGASAVVDFRLLGFAPRIPIPSLRPLFGLVWWAFAVNAITGVLLFMSDATTKGTQPVFYIKLSIIGLALWNMTLTRRVVDDVVDVETPLAPRTASRARRLASLSLLLWTGAIVAGRLMAYL
jgi:hypothetical protein